MTAPTPPRLAAPFPAASQGRRPHLAWLWLGVAIAVLAAGFVVAYSATDQNEDDAAGSTARSGPGEVPIEVSQGKSYGVYFPADEAPEFAASLTCQISTGGGTVTPLVLDEWGGGYDGPERREFGQTWQAVGLFESPTDGSASVACEGAESGLLVRPDDDVLLGVGLPVVLGVLVAVAGSALAIAVGITRSRRRGTGSGGPGDSFYAPRTPDLPPAPYVAPPPWERGPGFPGPGAGAGV